MFKRRKDFKEKVDNLQKEISSKHHRNKERNAKEHDRIKKEMEEKKRRHQSYS